MSSRAALKDDQAVEQAAAGAIAETRDGRRGGNRVVGEQRLDRARLPLGAQFWRGVGEPGRAARQVLGQVEGGERRARVAQRHELAPARFARARPPSLACGAAHKQLAGEERQRRWPAEGLGQRGVGAKIASGSASARSAITASAAAAAAIGAGRPRAARLRERGGELRRLLRVERRLQVGRDGGEPLGAEGVAGVGQGRGRRNRPVPPARAPPRAWRGRPRRAAPPRPRAG